MVVGWRMYEDLEKLADLVNARVTIDVLRHTAVKDGSEPLSLKIVEELGAWLAKRMAAAHVSRDAVSAVTLRLDVRSDRIATDRKRIVLFDFDCQCLVSTPERTYEGTVTEQHTWHQRVGA